jgi:hypothetical protein
MRGIWMLDGNAKNSVLVIFWLTVIIVPPSHVRFGPFFATMWANYSLLFDSCILWHPPELRIIFSFWCIYSFILTCLRILHDTCAFNRFNPLRRFFQACCRFLSLGTQFIIFLFCKIGIILSHVHRCFFAYYRFCFLSVFFSIEWIGLTGSLSLFSFLFWEDDAFLHTNIFPR